MLTRCKVKVGSLGYLSLVCCNELRWDRDWKGYHPPSIYLFFVCLPWSFIHFISQCGGYTQPCLASMPPPFFSYIPLSQPIAIPQQPITASPFTGALQLSVRLPSVDRLYGSTGLRHAGPCHHRPLESVLLYGVRIANCRFHFFSPPVRERDPRITCLIVSVSAQGEWQWT